MSSILETIAEKTRVRVAQAKESVSFEQVREQALAVISEESHTKAPRHEEHEGIFKGCGIPFLIPLCLRALVR